MSPGSRLAIRVAAAAIISPLALFVIVPIYFAAVRIPVSIGGSFELVRIILSFAYLEMLFIGVPAYLLLRRWHFAKIWSVVLVGFFATFLVVFGLTWQTEPAMSYPKQSTFLAENLASHFGLAGAIVAAIFWLIVNFGVRSGARNA